MGMLTVAPELVLNCVVAVGHFAHIVCDTGVHAEICTVPAMHVVQGVHWRSLVDGLRM
jgi:hypothetical protein